jgi:hypothetical protein
MTWWKGLLEGLWYRRMEYKGVEKAQRCKESSVANKDNLLFSSAAAPYLRSGITRTIIPASSLFGKVSSKVQAGALYTRYKKHST